MYLTVLKKLLTNIDINKCKGAKQGVLTIIFTLRVRYRIAPIRHS